MARTNIRGNAAKATGPGLTDNVAPPTAHQEEPEPQPKPEVEEVTTLQQSPEPTREQRAAADAPPSPILPALQAHTAVSSLLTTHTIRNARAEDRDRAERGLTPGATTRPLAANVVPEHPSLTGRITEPPAGGPPELVIPPANKEAVAAFHSTQFSQIQNQERGSFFSAHDIRTSPTGREVNIGGNWHPLTRGGVAHLPTGPVVGHEAEGQFHLPRPEVAAAVQKAEEPTTATSPHYVSEPETPDPNIVQHQPERIVTRPANPATGDPGAIQHGELQDIPHAGGGEFPVDFVPSISVGGEHDDRPASPPSQADVNKLDTAAEVGMGAILKPEHVMYARTRRRGGVDVFTNEKAFQTNQPHDPSKTTGTGSTLNDVNDQVQTEVHRRLRKAVPDKTFFGYVGGKYTGSDAYGTPLIPEHPHNAELEAQALQRWDSPKPRLLFMARAHAMAADPDMGIGDVSRLQPHHIELIANSVATKHPFNSETLSHQEWQQRDATNRALDAGQVLSGIISARSEEEARGNIATSNALQRARRNEEEENYVGEAERSPETGRLPGSPAAFPPASVDADTRSAQESADKQLRDIAGQEYSESMNAPEDVVEGRVGPIASDILDTTHNREFGAAETQMHLTQIRLAEAQGRDPREVLAGLRAAGAGGGYSIVEASEKGGFKPVDQVKAGKSSSNKETYAGAQKETQRFLAANSERIRGMKKTARKQLRKQTRATENATSADVVATQMRAARVESEAAGDRNRAYVPPEVQAAQMASAIENDKYMGGPTANNPAPLVPEAVKDSEGNNRLVTQVPVEPGSRQPRAPWAPRNPETGRLKGSPNPRRPAGMTSVTGLTAVGEALLTREVTQRVARQDLDPKRIAARAASDAYVEAVRASGRAWRTGSFDEVVATAQAEEAARKLHEQHQRGLG